MSAHTGPLRVINGDGAGDGMAAELAEAKARITALEEALGAVTGLAAVPDPAPDELAVALASPQRRPRGVRLPGDIAIVLKACREQADPAVLWQQVRAVLGGQR